MYCVYAVWFCVNKLYLNIANTNYILFWRFRHKKSVAININNAAIKRVQATKFLGVIIDELLNWKKYINSVKSKLSNIASVIYNVSHFIDQRSMYTLYCSLFLTDLMYCS